ncbi:4F2 cell-surface antigen heavy chain [Echeneis naucrates]|uniref:Glycosyl hydrolase family 13 catalytic domain-containing protein n=1 Tax=Echeneis naucrates TaxID=173247 RepID=A0A665TE80_ECHNA|nr:4F2 cell-surface antigen heavy chain [Echeneis naucrates]XP_029382236.1 4F2 cell-surface antigen heavy chain [Echeneis naucrates]XP_029382237.1 4F2 cell-surface antigen heavy chain [Echeneis naucrates]
MSKDTEIDMKEVELNELDPEKQPMTGDGQTAGGEKNGSVKLKVPEEEVTFTGLSKEELMKVASTPGWVRTRWVLLLLFWLGWVGMLAGAIVIIVQAPRCKPIPEMNWWNEGPLYQISDLIAFSNGMEGVEAKLDDVNQLKVKGLVLGPLHTVQIDQPHSLDFKAIDPRLGNEEQLVSVMKKAQKKGISVVLDLTPNYQGTSLWFSSADTSHVMEKLKAAAEYWLTLGVDGIKVSDLAVASSSPEWPNLQAVVQGNRTGETKTKKALMGVVEGVSAANVSRLTNTTGVDLIISDLLSSENGGQERIKALDTLQSQQRSLGWGLGATQRDQLSKLAKTETLVRLYHLLLFTMPGTPVFTYGDEIGLQADEDGKSPVMVWDVEKEPAEGEAGSEAAQAKRKEQAELRKWFRSLSDLRAKERSLLHGDYYPLYSSASSLAFLRLWDQSERYITAVNWGAQNETLTLSLAPTEGVELPETAKVMMSGGSNNSNTFIAESSVSLNKFILEPGQGVLMYFPYTG